MNWKYFVESGRSLILIYYPCNSVERLRKTTKSLNKDSRTLGLRFEKGPPEYEAGVLKTNDDFR
jgi:hypothetical protein